MPHITVSIPESKSDPLMRQLLTQFQTMQRSLQKLKVPAQLSHGGSDKMLQSMMRMMERMLKTVAGSSHGSSHDVALTQAMRGMKQTMASLPTSLKSALKGSMARSSSSHVSKTPRPSITIKPTVKVSLNGLGKRFDRLEHAMGQMGKSRNRTFGSNF